MKQLFVAIFLVASLGSFAQKEFAPIGAEWYYEKMLSQNPPEAGYIKLTSIKDSTIENKAVRVIEVLFAPNDSTQIVEGYEYLHQSGDTIWYWKNKQFHMLYNFAMQKGDSILLYSEMINQCSMNDPYGWNRVDSVFTHTYNGLTLKSYTSSPINQSVWGFEMHTSEIIGNLKYLIPQNKDCLYDGIWHGPLRCYSDPVHGVLFTSMPQMKCDSTYTYTGPLVPDPIIHAFIDRNRHWTLSEKIVTESEALAPQTLHFKFGPDSLVAGRTYTKMLLSNDGSNWQVHSLWRKDGQNNIYSKRGMTAEVPIFNFMLNEGDRFGNGEQEIVIDSTKIKQFGTVQRKHLYGHYANIPNSSILWIDGIGSMFGPHINDNFFLVGGDCTLICIEEAGQQVYLNPNYKSCNASDLKKRVVAEDKVWSQTTIASGEGAAYVSFFEKIEGDTLIDGRLYQRVFRSYTSDQSVWEPCAFVREDTQTQQVFKFNSQLSQEVLLYDFSLEEGDSIYSNGEYVHVNSISYKHFGNSPTTLKHIEFVYQGQITGTWVEGIGSLDGLLLGVSNLTPIVGGDSYLVCYSEQGTQMWRNPQFETCFPEGTNNSIDVLDNSSLRYSIRDGHVYIQAENLSTQGAEFVVYDIMGRAVYSMKLDRQSSWTISRSAIPDGTYIYQIQMAEGVITGKLLVR